MIKRINDKNVNLQSDSMFEHNQNSGIYNVIIWVEIFKEF